MKPFVLHLGIDKNSTGNTCLVEAHVCWEGGSKRFSIEETNVIPSNYFTNVRLEETREMIKNRAFEMVDISEITEESCVFESILMEHIKLVDNEASRNFWPAAQSYRDDKAATIAIDPPTFRWITQRLILSKIVCPEHTSAIARDHTHTYIQYGTAFERDLNFNLLKKMNFPSNKRLKVTNAPYVIPEGSLHGYLTYVGHRVAIKDMQQSRVDRWLLYKQKNRTLEDMAIVQVDYRFTAGPDTLMQMEI